MKNWLLVLLICLFLIFPVTAVDYKTVNDFFNDFPSLNEKIQANDVIIPNPVDMLISSGNVLVSIQGNNSTKDFYLTVQKE